jgi:predicted flavoprotein YhiN
MTDIDVGIYSINFTSNMVANSYTTNWNVNGSYTDAISIVIGYGGAGAPSTGANGAGIKSQNTSGIRGDHTENAISIHGELA